jgi:hypothetical protein
MSVQENVQIVKDGFAAFGPRRYARSARCLWKILSGSFPAKVGPWPAGRTAKAYLAIARRRHELTPGSASMRSLK